MNNKSIIIVSAMLFLLPVVSLAALPAMNGITDVGALINRILDVIWKLFVGAAVISFMVAGFEFLTAQGEITKIQLARKAVIFGVVGIVVAIIGFSMVLFISNVVAPATSGGGGGWTGTCKGYRALCTFNAECCNGICAVSFNTATTTVCN